MVIWLRTMAEIIQKIRGRDTNKEMEGQARLHGRRALDGKVERNWEVQLK